MDEQMLGNEIKEEDDIIPHLAASPDSQNHNDYDSMNQGSNLYDTSLMLHSTNQLSTDDITAHLASSGLAGVAAAAAIQTSHRKSMLFNFETVPAVRKRHSTRLLRKIQQLIDEFSVRVGQQACLIVCSPKSAYKSTSESLSMSNSTVFKVFGASPLDGVLRSLKDVIIQNLENSLQNYQIMNNTQNFFQPTEVLPPLMVDGIPTPLDKMTQAQLRAFIPIMLKFSTGRTKPSWGRETSIPPWWPKDVPWANVRSDVRSEEQKQRQSWTNALKKVVKCCYDYHGKSHYLFDYPQQHMIQSQNHNSNQLQRNSSNVVNVSVNFSLNSGMMNSEMIDLERHHNSISYSTNNRHDRIHNQCNNRHILMDEQENVEAQLRALQTTYAIQTGQDGTISLVHLEANDRNSIENTGMPNENEYLLMEDSSCNQLRSNGLNIKVEDLVSLPPGTVVQLDSSSTAELYQLLTNNNNGNNEDGINDENLSLIRNVYDMNMKTELRSQDILLQGHNQEYGREDSNENFEDGVSNHEI